MKEASEEGQNGQVATWDPRRQLRAADADVARWSRGFLRCRPEKWFPGFGAQWLPLVHSLGIDARVTEVRTFSAAPRNLEKRYAGSIDGESMAVCVDLDSERVFLDAFVPGGLETAREVAEEYLARRLISSLGMSWSGPESSVVRFEPHMDPFTVKEAGAIKLAVSLNGNPCTCWIVLERAMVERLDGLWRRQIRSTSRRGSEPVPLRIEVAQLAVPHSVLADYVRPGTVVDLETPATDQIVLRVGDRPWLPARIAECQGHFAFEILPGVASGAPVPEGMARFSIEFGSISADAPMLAELGQVGAVCETEIPVSPLVNIIVNGQKAGEASLCMYEGRFAITVR